MGTCNGRGQDARFSFFLHSTKNVPGTGGQIIVIYSEGDRTQQFIRNTTVPVRISPPPYMDLLYMVYYMEYMAIGWGTPEPRPRLNLGKDGA